MFVGVVPNPATYNLRTFNQAQKFIHQVDQATGPDQPRLVAQAVSNWDRQRVLPILLTRCQELLRLDNDLVAHLELLKAEGNDVAHAKAHFTFASLFEHYKERSNVVMYEALDSLSTLVRKKKFALSF